MYNQFVGDYDKKLNDVFANFKSNGVTDLVLDLRYNPGGSVDTAINLGSMVTGQFEDKPYVQFLYNNKLKSENEKLNFKTEIVKGSHINSLKLSEIYIIATKLSASASEMTINGLRAYINVHHIGTKTVGKYTASITIYDSKDGRKSGVNPTHKYAIQPIILKVANADGRTDFDDGLYPDIPLKEDFSHMGVLGDESEPLLAKAIEQITGRRSPVTYASAHTKPYFAEVFSSVNELELLPNEMYINKPIPND
ncbi:peptidase, S41 family [Elysia marginata]|uniref:Peptidase, S41 family n=1 Tax=Elysia marginata TaxID=1093978 RepID=A0AAV4GXF4_9GAST|nr:peptidase, S41 family [Elysia marginata]